MAEKAIGKAIGYFGLSSAHIGDGFIFDNKDVHGFLLRAKVVVINSPGTVKVWVKIEEILEKGISSSRNVGETLDASPYNLYPFP